MFDPRGTFSIRETEERRGSSFDLLVLLVHRSREVGCSVRRECDRVNGKWC